MLSHILVTLSVLLHTALGLRDGAQPPAFRFPGSERGPDSGWDVIFEAARSDPALRKALFEMVAGADATLSMSASWYQRARRFEDIPPTQVDSLALRAGDNRDLRALAMDDCRQADFLRSKALGLAVAARYASREDCLSRVLEILHAVTEWEPFQRPGWSLGAADRTLPKGGDGVNMATAWGVHGVIDILEVLGNRVPEDLRFRLRNRLRGEVAQIVDSWQARRPWYVQSSAAMSNQWVDPSAALVRACLFLRDSDLSDDYELGVRNIGSSIALSASDGAFLEGITYAQMSFPALFQAILSMHAAGDGRFSDGAFVGSAWKWFLHQLMPCGALVNCSDSHMSRLPEWAMRTPLDGLSMAALASGSTEAMSIVRTLFPDVPSTFAGLRLAAACPLPRARLEDLKPWAFFPSQQLVTWRESFRRPTDAGSEVGLWVKGGSSLCRSHGHRDQGHVSVYRGCDVVLLECGTPEYGDSEYTEYASAPGHGILQIDPVQPHGQAIDAPISIARLDASGGRLSVDLAKAHRGAVSYERTVEWTCKNVGIQDSATFVAEIPKGTEVLRYHVGSREPPRIERASGAWTIVWEGATLRVSSGASLRVSAERWPDRTTVDGVHYVVRVELLEALRQLQVVADLEF